MPNIGDRVQVRPRHGLQVQRGEALYGQVIPQDGMECTWDDYLEARQGEGCIEVVPVAQGLQDGEAIGGPRVHVPGNVLIEPAPAEGPPAIPSIPPLPRGRRGEEPT